MSHQTLTHLNDQGEAHMVDVGDKAITSREATAQAWVYMQHTTLEAILSAQLKKEMCLPPRALLASRRPKRLGN